MNCLKTKPLMIFLFPLLFFISSTFVSPSYGAFHLYVQDPHFPEFLDKSIHHRVVDENRRRIAAETTENSTYIILAETRTHRRDPSDDFKYYTGGWNITNSHYLYSVAFSAAGPFIVAAIWFVVFAICLLSVCICRCCCRKEPYGYSRTAYALSVVFLILFTLAAIAGIVFLYVGQTRFQSSVEDTLSYFLHQADNVIVNLKNLVDSLLEAKKVGLGQITLPIEIQGDIDGIGKRIDTVADEFRNVTLQNSQDIRSFLRPLRLTVICVASALLILAVLGFVLSILGMQCLVYCLVIIGWILVAATFIMSGVFLLVHNVIADTCVAMNEWLQNPNANSALEHIIPKVDNKTTEDISSVTKGVTFGMVNIVNGVITNVSNANVPPNAGPLYYNQSGALMPLLCNPYNSNLSDSQCAAVEVNLNNASQVWRNYVCQVSSSEICITPGRLTPNLYSQMTTLANVSYGLYTGMPFVVDLIDATYLKETFADISRNYCPNLRQYTEWVYLGFITSSSAVMLSLILWVIYARERRHRVYTKNVNNRPSGNLLADHQSPQGFGCRFRSLTSCLAAGPLPWWNVHGVATIRNTVIG